METENKVWYSLETKLPIPDVQYGMSNVSLGGSISTDAEIDKAEVRAKLKSEVEELLKEVKLKLEAEQAGVIDSLVEKRSAALIKDYEAKLQLARDEYIKLKKSQI